MKKCILALLVGFIFTSASIPVMAQTISSSVNDGGRLESYSADINGVSSLRRSWITINDIKCPLKIENTGIKTSYVFQRYRFEGDGYLVSSLPITAFEIRFILYDVFGSHIKTLSATEVTDIAVDEKFNFSEWKWSAHRNEISELLTSVAFVAQVRTADGEVWRYDEDAIAEELLKIQNKSTTEDLEATREEG